MKRINTDTKAENLFGAGKHGFRTGNPLTGVLPTQLSAEWSNAVQEAICRVIEGAGLVVGGGDDQLLTAIQAIGSVGAVTSISANTTLTAGQRGLVLVNASAGNRTITLPSANQVMDFVVRRVDNTSNKLLVQAHAGEKIMHNTWINADGYDFLRLFGAGDYWVLRSDGEGSWHPINRLDSAPIGSLHPNIADLIPAGGYCKPNGAVLTRADYPWLWDLAGVSGNLVSEAAWAAGQQGGFSTGDTATTFRVLELRGEFVRVWDDGRGADTGRGIGSWKADSIKDHKHFRNESEHEEQALDGDTPGSKGTIGGGSSSDSLLTITGGMTAAAGTETAPRNIAVPWFVKMI
ncbi:MAG TPA: hypothetical protein VFW42_02300 [Fluviicoccus sp.]|nr:hypothetical protein [Fluviicoccus sp.]